MKIAGKTVYEQQGSMSRSGDKLEVILACACEDMAAVWGAMVHGAKYTTLGDAGTGVIQIGGAWYDMYSSSAVAGTADAYGLITLTFSFTQIQTMNLASGGIKYDPVYSMESGSMDAPIEQHPDYKAKWNNNLYVEQGVSDVPAGGSAAPSFWANATDPNAEYYESSTVYRFGKVPPAPRDAAHVWTPVTACTMTKPGVEAYILPQPVVTSTVYYREANVSSSDLSAVGKLKAPARTYIYANDDSKWLVTRCTIQPSGDKLAVTTAYQYRENGWDTDIYSLAVPPAGTASTAGGA